MRHPVWKGRIHFGLLCIPAKFCAAARHDSIELHLVRSLDPPEIVKAAAAGGRTSNVVEFPTNDPTAERPIPARVERVRQAWVGSDGTVVSRSDLWLAWQYFDGRLVPLTQSELKKIRPPTSNDLRIAECVDPREIDLNYYGASFDVWPDEGGEAGYEILHSSLAKKRKVAIIHAPILRRRRLLMMRAGASKLVVHNLYFPDEVRLDDVYQIKPGLASKKDRERGAELVEEISHAWEPEKYKNTDRDRLLELIACRTQSTTPTKGGRDKPRPPVLFKDLLDRSIELARKGPKRERGGPGSRNRTKRPPA